MKAECIVRGENKLGKAWSGVRGTVFLLGGLPRAEDIPARSRDRSHRSRGAPSTIGSIVSRSGGCRGNGDRLHVLDVTTGALSFVTDPRLTSRRTASTTDAWTARAGSSALRTITGATSTGSLYRLTLDHSDQDLRRPYRPELDLLDPG